MHIVKLLEGRFPNPKAVIIAISLLLSVGLFLLGVGLLYFP